MTLKRFNISLPADLLAELDAAATADFTSRSAYIRKAIVLRLRVESYIEQEVIDKNSYPNIVKSLHFSKLLNRRINKHKHLPYED